MQLDLSTWARVGTTFAVMVGFALAACGAPTLPIPPPAREPEDAGRTSAEASPWDAPNAEVEPDDAPAREVSSPPVGAPDNTATATGH
jgi:hypothetical protein